MSGGDKGRSLSGNGVIEAGARDEETDAGRNPHGGNEARLLSDKKGDFVTGSKCVGMKPALVTAGHNSNGDRRRPANGR